MKEIEIGDETYKLCEGVDDLYDIRFPSFLSYLRMSLEGIDKPLFAMTMEKAEQLMDAKQWMKAWKQFDNYNTAINLPQTETTGLSMCFALICIEEGEDQVNVDESGLEKKLAKMRKAGLKRGFVEESVRNFMKASPDSFGDYIVLQEMMQEMKEHIL